MKLHFLGANRQVTGSRYCLETEQGKLLIDCGMFQEREFLDRNWAGSPVPVKKLDAVLLTHVHIDHSGLLPKLVQQGYRGPIYATRPSCELADPLLRDAAEIQEEDAAYKQRRHQKERRKGKHPEIPLYTSEDVKRTLPLFKAVSYGRPMTIFQGVTATFYDAGHILGSAMIELHVAEQGQTTRILFSGDIGQHDKPLICDPTYFREADYVIMESTYGDRDHEARGEIETQLADIINTTVRRGGNVIIPTFAVERAQELMFYISRLVHRDRIPDVAVYLDSPMAVDVTDIYLRHPDAFDRESWQLVASGEPPLHFPGLRLVRSVQESRAINDSREPAIIMATSGMCTSGRIKHHLRHNLERTNSTILFVGYQGRGTLGRQILEKNPEVRIHGREYRVRAEIAQLYGFSGHADRSGLMKWVRAFQRPPRQLFLTHGEEEAANSLAKKIREELGWNVIAPKYQDVVTLQTGSAGANK
jgi:metallo-beta-lactamase family protein